MHAQYMFDIVMSTNMLTVLRIYIYIYIYTILSVYTIVSMPLYNMVSSQWFSDLRVNTKSYTHGYTYAYGLFVHVFIYIHICIYIYIYTHTHTHICIYIQVSSDMLRVLRVGLIGVREGKYDKVSYIYIYIYIHTYIYTFVYI